MERRVLVHNPNNPVTVSVERVTGPFDDPSLTEIANGASSMVLKTLSPKGEVVVPHWTTSNDADHWNLWNRELLAYTSGLVRQFDIGGAPGDSLGVRAPTLLGRIDNSDGSVTLCLEDVDGRTGAALTRDDHQRIARRLGRSQGTLRGRMKPVDTGPSHSDARPHSGDSGFWQAPWLSRSWVEKYATTRLRNDDIYRDTQAWEHPVVVEGFGDGRHEMRRRYGELYRHCDRWFDTLRSLPQTLCHLDFWPNNAIASNDGSDVMVDWAFVGWGAIGEDPGNWVPDSVFDHFVEPDEIRSFESAVTDAYLSGLAEVGCDAPEDLVRLGMMASAVKYIWLPGLMVERADHSGPTAYGGQEGFDLVEVFARRAPMLMRLLEWIDEAERLASQVF